MKKFIKLLSVTVLVSILLTACTKPKEASFKIGVSPRPHKELVDFIKEDFEKDGLKLEIVEFTDYIKPNEALEQGELDANFFQHKPYLEEFSKQRNFDLVSAGPVHIEPMGVYSSSLKSIKDLKKASKISIPNDVTNGGRALLLLEKEGLIKLDPSKGIIASESDIIENPLELEFLPLEAAMLPKMIDDVDASIINGNYALEADLTLDKAILLEDKDSPYANIVAVKKENLEKEEVKKLMELLQSPKMKEFIETGFDNSIIPAF